LVNGARFFSIISKKRADDPNAVKYRNGCPISR
jgi:hypothetical protein